jgi:hypothetical protein
MPKKRADEKRKTIDGRIRRYNFIRRKVWFFKQNFITEYCVPTLTLTSC